MSKQSRFAETHIATKFGEFNIRVYADDPGKETVVLYTNGLDPSHAILVRLHSECMTGDLFGSRQCDCGEQLSTALKLIQRQGGVLVYLRQEGRGIGLFEKIRSYQLQRKGFDTFEANVLLGHRPDERTYEKAKMALDDLRIKRIRLLTNNPSKVSEIAKLGVSVVERVPIIVRSNKWNKKYFDTKRDKFKHFFNQDVSYYFYQFHADLPEQIEAVGEFLRDKKRDPLLKICVGISADHRSLNDKKEFTRIVTLFKACELYEGFVPILHFSFRESPNASRDIRNIKKIWPFVKYLQTNDLDPTDLGAILLSCKLFLADIPLHDENFNLVHKVKFRDAITKHKAFLLLDNSKGKGIRESKESLQKKIDILLSYGLNDIAIFGGFGPDDLDTYFDLRRFYKINFSIDAETKLQTSGKIDLEKTKRYLSQLIRFDDPKQAGIEQTRTFLQQNRREDWDKAMIEGKEFLVHPAVFHPGSFPSTAWYADEIRKLTKGAKDVCEVGCGTGAISCLVGLSNRKVKIVATDINPFAAENTRFNAERLGLAGRVEVVTGDVLDEVSQKRKFDAIFWALPFGFLDPGVVVSLEEMQVFDPGYRATRKFFSTAKSHLKPAGRLVVGFSSDLGHQELLQDLAAEYGIRLQKVAQKEMVEKEKLMFEVFVGTYKKGRDRKRKK